MLPVTAGIKHTKYQIFIYSVLLILASFSLVYVKPIGLLYLVSASVLGAIYLYLAGRLFGNKNPAYGMKLFGYSIFYLFMLFTALILDTVVL